jgi:hypothetical protein
VDEIERLHPQRVLIVGILANSDSATEICSAAGYRALCNERCSLGELRRMMQQVRAGHANTVLISNFPRDCEAATLRLTAPEDLTTPTAVFLVGPFAMGYVKNLQRCQAQGRESRTAFQVLVSADESYLLTSERKQLQACTEPKEQRRLLQEIATKLENNPDSAPIYYWGWVLVG